MGRLKGSKLIRGTAVHSDLGTMEVDMSIFLDELDDDELELDQADETWTANEAELSERIEPVDEDADWIDDDMEAEVTQDEGEFDSVAHYFRESARHRLLSPDHERTLTQAVKRGRVARKKLTRATRAVSTAEQKKLRSDIDHGMEARDELVRANARLVISIAKRYQNLGLPLMDLIQEGNIGLLRAIDRF
jgi:DNA-directed RNA polymerase sigma subunit (sigma70/sigma32)